LHQHRQHAARRFAAASEQSWTQSAQSSSLGTTLAAASALGSVASVRNARAQGPAGWVVVSMKDDWNTIFAEIPK
jgi:hypothetical protein